jgi:hypothetical protein
MLHVGLHDVVDDAGDGVRAVDRRCAAGDDFDPLDEVRRDVVDVDDRRARHARHEPPAIDQHQRARIAEIAKVDRRYAVTGRQEVAVRAAEAGNADLGKLCQQVLRVDDTLRLDLLRVDDRDRRCGLEIGTTDARPGNDDCVIPGCGRLGCSDRLRSRSGCSCILRKSGNRQSPCGKNGSG